MSVTTKFPNIAEIEEQTSQWLAAIDRGLTADEQEQLQSWLMESPVHGETLVHFASVWDLMDLVAPVAKLLPLNERFDVQHPQLEDDYGYEPRQMLSGWLPASAVLAGLLIMVMIFAVFPEPEDKRFVSVYKTEVGEQSAVMLPDGSRLELNTNTEVSVYLSDPLRRVVLVRGEAYFDVAKNLEVPFVAEVGETQVVAVGTAFNIELVNANAIEVMVTEGKVLVDKTGAQDAVSKVDKDFSRMKPSELDEDELFLTVGEKAIVIRDQVEPKVVDEQFDLETDLAWRDGMLIFAGESLEQAISEINRYTRLTLEISDPGIRDIQVGGYFRAGDTDELLVILKNNFGIDSQRKGDRILLRSALR